VAARAVMMMRMAAATLTARLYMTKLVMTLLLLLRRPDCGLVNISSRVNKCIYMYETISTEVATVSTIN